MRNSALHISDDPSVSAATRRRARQKLLALRRKDAMAARAVGVGARVLKAEFRNELIALAGAAGMRRYRALRKELAGKPRSQRLRQSHALLDELGLDRRKVARLRAAYLEAARKLLNVGELAEVLDARFTDPCASPQVTYMAPYAGSFWSYRWSRSDEASDPVLERYLDRNTGRIGSSILTRLDGADNDDAVDAEYYTALNVWHTALADGPIEGYLAFEFRDSTYSADISDEFGFSTALVSQYALARFRIVDPQGAAEVNDARIFNVFEFFWGEDRSWSNYVAAPRDLHWYYFRTSASYARGSLLLLEAGVLNATWFHADDESVETADNLDLRLDRIVVQSCPG